MRALPWIVASASFGTVIYILQNSPSSQPASAQKTLDEVANKSGVWGTKQRVGGTGRQLTGDLKEGAGKLTGDQELQGEGLFDQAAGDAKSTAGKAAGLVSDTLHDLAKG